MEKIRLTNSFLAFIEYDKEEKALFLTLQSGKRFKYTSYTEGSWNKLKEIKNKGNHIAVHVIGSRKYKYEFVGIVPPAVVNKNNNYYKFLAR